MHILYKKKLSQEHVEPKNVTHVESINIIYTYIIYFSKSRVLLKKGIESANVPRLESTILGFILYFFPLQKRSRSNLSQNIGLVYLLPFSFILILLLESGINQNWLWGSQSKRAFYTLSIFSSYLPFLSLSSSTETYYLEMQYNQENAHQGTQLNLSFSAHLQTRVS